MMLSCGRPESTTHGSSDPSYVYTLYLTTGKHHKFGTGRVWRVLGVFSSVRAGYWQAVVKRPQTTHKRRRLNPNRRRSVESDPLVQLRELLCILYPV